MFMTTKKEAEIALKKSKVYLPLDASLFPNRLRKSARILSSFLCILRRRLYGVQNVHNRMKT